MIAVGEDLRRREIPAEADIPAGRRRRDTTWHDTPCKRVMDYVLGVALIILTAPVLAAVMLAVKLTSRGPVLYTQRRLGLRGRPYTIYKIRTMRPDCERQTGPRWAERNDPRVTPVGRLLRRTHLDELPQLWNVLRGEMSLVGPRPERPEFVAQLERAIPRYRDRMLVLPGVTGLAQVQLPPDTDLASVERKLACDLYYIQRAGFWLDARIILGTASNVVGVPSAWPRMLLQLPTGDAVQGAYRDIVEAGAGRQVQPA